MYVPPGLILAIEKSVKCTPAYFIKGACGGGWAVCA